MISVRLLECVLFLAGAVLLAHGLVEGRTGAALFTCAYGFVLGAYHYVTKVLQSIFPLTTSCTISYRVAHLV